MSVSDTLTNCSVLITGGTGSFGVKFIADLLKNHNPSRVVVFSRDELKQSEMMARAPFKDNRKLRFFIGDVRDRERLIEAMRDIDIVIHAAALKQVPSCEFYPLQAVYTNVLGTENTLNAAVENDVKNAAR